VWVLPRRFSEVHSTLPFQKEARRDEWVTMGFSGNGRCGGREGPKLVGWGILWCETRQLMLTGVVLVQRLVARTTLNSRKQCQRKRTSGTGHPAHRQEMSKKWVPMGPTAFGPEKPLTLRLKGGVRKSKKGGGTARVGGGRNVPMQRKAPLRCKGRSVP